MTKPDFRFEFSLTLEEAMELEELLQNGVAQNLKKQCTAVAEEDPERKEVLECEREAIEELKAKVMANRTALTPRGVKYL